MAREREVGTLWIGGALSWLEQLCLKSFVDAGQRITLFSYHDIPNVPEGVIRRDGREIIETEDFLKYEKKDSFALFADLFRLHMLRQCPGMIWVDTDVYCLRPMAYDSDYVFGHELPDSDRINNAVLGLPADSAVLADMLDFTADPFAVPPFVKPRLRAEYEAAALAGQPVHVSAQQWGVWGPMMLTHFIRAHGLTDRAQPLDAFYPIPFPERIRMIRAASKVEARLTGNTTALHLWASNKRELGRRFHGLPRRGSYLAKLVEAHGIRPELAPIRGRGGELFESGLVEALELDRVASIGDLGGTARAAVLGAWLQHDCDIVLIDADRRGEFPQAESRWVAEYRAFLEANGVPAEAVRVVRRAADLRPVDLLLNLQNFGDRAKIKHIAPFLRACLHSDSVMVTDIRKKSGSYPFLNDFGACETLSERDDDGIPVTRALFRPKAPEAAGDAGADPDWAAMARDLAGPQGFFRDNGLHSFLYIPRGDTLVVSFDNLDIAMNKREGRKPWGFDFIARQGWSMLGVMANGWTWYRDPWVCDQFDALAAEGFFDRFERVVFYGASMGGYAAAAFSGAAPGAEVVAISPQSTVDKAVVPWETRYKVVWDADFSGKYGDAARVSGAARRVTILYDPYEPLDAGHADRFTAPNVVRLRTPLLGHRLGSSLQQMGILNDIILGALSGQLTERDFYRRLRARKDFPRYQKELFQRALDRDRPELARRLGRYVLARGDHRFIRQRMQGL
ncbi:hypothetical protein [Acidimangrovimonas pyrenivorans]|uniref:Alpha 1,4-glycosyltransferase domain-containing protein n=1 Tax=Acidimangrovimonas pyrenivorans TaxID=2030798 RepID=A0ABV7AH80_9RHOB